MHSGEGSGAGSHLARVRLGYKNQKETLLTRGGDDGAVGNNDAGLAEVGLELLLHDNADLSEGAMRSVGDSHQEVLGLGAVALLVVDELSRVEEDDLQVLLLVGGGLGGQRVKGLGDLLLKLGGLHASGLDNLVSFMEHVCVVAVGK